MNDVVYSVHAPGLPTLLLPAYAVSGAWGAVGAVILMAALTGALIFAAAERLAGRGVAWLTWAATAFTVPFAPHAWLIYPELPAALIMAAVAWWILQPPPSTLGAWVVRGAALALLPWLHIKYSALLAAATLCLLVRAGLHLRHVAALLAPMVVSGVLWLAAFQVMYGTPNPLVVYGGGAELDLGNIPRGGLGVLFDQEFGILLYSPIFALVPVGAWVMWRTPSHRWPLVGLVGIASALLLSFTPYYMWWGGYSAPARFAVPAVPLVAPLLAVAAARARSAAARGVVGLLLLVSVGTLAALMAAPARGLQFNDRDGAGRFVELWQGGVDFTRVLPTFIQPDWSAQLPAVLAWIAAAMLAAAAAWFVGRHGASRTRAFWSGGVAAIVFVGAVAVLRGASLSAAGEQSLVRGGQQAALIAHRGAPMFWWRYRPSGVVAGDALLDQLTVRQRAFDHRWRQLGRTRRERDRVAGPFALAPGRYEVRVWLDERAPRAARDEVWVTFHRGPGLMARRSVASTNPVSMVLDLPVTVGPTWVGATSLEAAEAITGIEIEPLATPPRPARMPFDDIRQVVAVGDVPGRYLLHVDDNVFVEERGFWVRGESRTRFFATPAGATRLRVLVRNGATPGPVVVRVADHEQTYQLGAFEETRLRLPLAGDETTVRVEIAPGAGFRPSREDAASNDHRWLGSWVEVALW